MRYVYHYLLETKGNRVDGIADLTSKIKTMDDYSLLKVLICSELDWDSKGSTIVSLSLIDTYEEDTRDWVNNCGD